MFAIVELHSGETVKLDAADEDGIEGTEPAIFDTEYEAQAYAMNRFGEVAGREYIVVDVDSFW